MKKNKVQRLLAATLAATMMMASALTAAAASGGSAGSAGSTSESVSTGESSDSSGGSGSSESVVSSIQTFASNEKVTVAGTAVRTTIAGAYAAETVQGVAVTTPIADIKASLGLSDSQTPYIVVFDTDAKKSNLAMNCVNAAAEALNGTTVATLNVDLAAKQNGNLVALSSGSVGMVVGLPKNADTSKTYSIVCVQPGGVVTILEDKDSSPVTVTFEVKAGLGTYGIVAR